MEDYQEIFEAIPDGITLHDAADGSIVDVNQRFCEMLGYTREELLELDFEALHIDEPPYTTGRTEQYVQKAATDGPQTFEWRDETKDGDTLPVEVHLKQTAIDGEQRVLAVVRDITERKKREHELERIYDQIEFALDATDTIIWTLDLSTGVSTDYGPIDRLFGMEPDGVTEFLAKVVHPDDRADAADLFEAVKEGETDRFDAEFRTVSGDTDGKWIASKGYVRESETDESRQLIGLATDISERKRRQEELQRKNERLEEFASIVSHDLRNPLNVAQGRLELAEEQCPSGDFDAIRRAHDRMESLIDDILALAREGEKATDVQRVALAEIAHRCWQTVDTADATLTLETERTIRADPSHLQQLMENLIRNAVEHGGGSVTVSVGELADGFYVADDGKGIPEDDRAHVFEVGYSPSDTGTGLGLSIVKRVVEAHDWDLTITESTDGGVRVEIRNVDTIP